MTEERFTASNGLYVENGQVYLPDGTRANADLSSVRAVVLIEYGAHKAQAQRDAELGRWRSVDHPDYSAVGAGDDSVRVCDESVLRVWGFTRKEAAEDPNAYWAINSEVACSVAREYFAAHPEPKPWHDAQPGEVWALTHHGEDIAVQRQVGDFDHLFATLDNHRSISVIHHGTTAGRRIWPEVSA